MDKRRRQVGALLEASAEYANLLFVGVFISVPGHPASKRLSAPVGEGGTPAPGADISQNSTHLIPFSLSSLNTLPSTFYPRLSLRWEAPRSPTFTLRPHLPPPTPMSPATREPPRRAASENNPRKIGGKLLRTRTELAPLGLTGTMGWFLRL